MKNYDAFFKLREIFISKSFNMNEIDIIELIRLIRVKYEQLLLENQELKLKLAALEKENSSSHA